ncbi:MAG TPA: PAS domain S-box protein [Blastocatellia bacterium]|nr:PAS domain S-box protein [Blastocatellia bacterium]
MLQTVLTSQPSPTCLIVAASEEAAVRLREELFPGSHAASEWVSGAEDFAAALSRQSWQMVICEAQLPQFSAAAALTLLEERGLAVPFVVLPAQAAASVSGAHSGELKPEVARAVGLLNSHRERQRADLVLRESERFFRTLIENSSDALMLLAASGKILYTWPSVRRVLGYEPAAFTGSQLVELLHPEDAADYQARLANLLQAEGAHDVSRCRFRHADGSWRWIESSSNNLINTPGVWAIVVNFHDVTEQELMTQALRDSEQLYRNFFTQNRAVMLLTEAETGLVADANAAAIEYYGYRPDELRGMKLQEIVIATEEQLELTLKEHHRSRFFRHRLASGEVRDVEVFSGPVEISGRKQIYSIVNDVTERLRIEEARTRLAAIIEATPDLIGSADRDGRLLYLNRAGRRLLGWGENESAPGLRVADYHPAWAMQLIREQGLPAAIRDGVWIGETAVLTPDGREIPVSQAIIAHRNAQGEVEFFSTIARDLSERREAEAERMRLQEQLYEVQKIESVGTLAGGIAHDFNNLLTAITGNTQLALSRLPQESRALPLLREVTRAADRAASLTRQLLAFSRRQRLERRSIDLSETIHDFLKLLERIIGENTTVRLGLSGAPVRVFADPRQIEQVVMNLAVNAREAMPEGGELLIEVCPVTLDEEFCRRHVWARPGRYGQLAISDTGCGMDGETLRRIFEPFFTTREQGAGTGLGLAVVYGIIKQHEGFIDVESEPGRGTTVRIYLPAPDADTARADEAAHASPAGHETILLAEDEPMLRNLAEEVLTGLGYRVLLARDGLEAVELYQTHRAQIDLLLLDVIMPRLGGIETYEQLTAAGFSPRVMFVTGYSADVINPELLRRTGALVISKPYDIDTLGYRIRKVLDEK